MSDAVQPPVTTDQQVPIGLQTPSRDGLRETFDPLYLGAPRAELVRTVDRRINASKKFFDGIYQLSTRRKELSQYYFGRQNRSRRFKWYESQYMDNVIWEAMASLKSIAFSKLADVTVTPNGPGPEALRVAQTLTKALNTDIKRRDRRKALKQAFTDLPFNFTGIIRVRWDPQAGIDGEICFEALDPARVVVDHTALSNSAQKMEYIAVLNQVSVQELLMRFPKRKQELLLELYQNSKISSVDSQTTAELASRVDVWEVWFTWYTKKEGGWEKTEGVCWKYCNCLFDAMKNPYFDYEGEQRLVTYDPNEAVIREARLEEIQASILGTSQQPLQSMTSYRNYLNQPEKPFFFFGYEQGGKMPYDETSWAEQSLPIQKNLDHRGKQITEMIDRNRGKHIWSADAMKAEDAEEIDLSDPDQDLVLDGNPNDVHEFIQPDLPQSALFADYENSRQRIFQKAGVQSTAGRVTEQTATGRQIDREADYTRADDLIEDTINASLEWMAMWELHMIKLYYTQEHLVRSVGPDGKVAFLSLQQSMVDKRQEVVISASVADKLKRERVSQFMANIKMTDPVTFYRDNELPDPEGRAEAFMAFNNPLTQAFYIAKFIMNNNQGDILSETMKALQAQMEGQAQAGEPPQPGQGTPPETNQPAQPEQPNPNQTQAVPSAPNPAESGNLTVPSQ